METKRIPFDINRINEENVKVVTRDGRNARIICTDLKGVQDRIAAAVYNGVNSSENVFTYYSNGGFYESGESGADLMLEIPAKPRRMTNRELSWWLIDHPEEYREWKYNIQSASLICHTYEYLETDMDKECSEDILIRRNGGEWEKPLMLIED